MALLEIQGLQKSFGKTEVLRGIDFTMERGEVLSILGPSGGGKTTLLRCLNFLEFADRGRIYVDGKLLYCGGESLKENRLRENRLHFGLVFQSFNLFPQYTAMENITLAPTLLQKGSPEEIRDRALVLLRRVGLEDKAGNYPYQLSGGQQQRVAIARALALEPEILCFDEPTSALDPELTGEVLRVIRSLKDTGSTMVIVTHELEFARTVSDRILFMTEGRIEEAGTPEQIFTAPRSEKTRQFLRHSLEEKPMI